jgi:hypothetical protein
VLVGNGARAVTGRLGGDYPAFYGAGRLILDTTGKRLYNFEDEAAVQKELLPKEVVNGGRAIPFPYPPFVALAYYPFSLLPYRLSFLLHTLLMMIAVGVAVRLLSRRTPSLDGRYDLALSAAMFYFPMFVAMIGGQNAPLTFFLYVSMWKAESSGRDWLAGLLLGLILFKPQFAIPLMGLHLLSGRYRTVAMSIVVAAGLYLIGAVTYGPHWIGDWFHYASLVSANAAVIDRYISVSWPGFLQAVLGAGSNVAPVIGYTLALATAGLISLVWYKGRHDPYLSTRFGLAPVALLLMQPHAMHYDMGLMLFTYAVCLTRKETSVLSLMVLWLLAPLQVVGNHLGFSPLFFLLLLSGALALHVLLPGGSLNGVGRRDHEAS